MGTRHLIAVKLDGEYKVAQYGQWDGYPSGQGVTVLSFLEDMNRPEFEAKLRASSFLTDDDIEELNKQIKAGGQNETWGKRWPELSRDTGAGILELVQNKSAGIKLVNRISFAADSLFCEYGYVIDLDANTFEVFEGFNKKPLAEDERFASMTPAENSDGYCQIRKIAQYSLDDLPSVQQFTKDCESEEIDD